MPPKKKTKVSASTNEDSKSIGSPAPPVVLPKEPPKPAYDILKDPWTDEQETSLFKGIIRWKPNGMHKHFRMIAISEHLRNHGYDPTVDKHTRIPGIWEKLKILYNMDIIDARENPINDGEDGKHFIDFNLPIEYEETMWKRAVRGPSEAASSPPLLGRSPPPSKAPSKASSPQPSSPPPTKKRKRADTSNTKTRASTVDDTDEAQTSPPPSPPAKITRSGRNTHRAVGRAKAESSSRAPSKDTTVDDNEDEGEEETEVADDDEEAEEEDGTPSPKTSKGNKAAKVQNPSRKSKRKR